MVGDRVIADIRAEEMRRGYVGILKKVTHNIREDGRRKVTSGGEGRLPWWAKAGWAGLWGK